MRIRSFLLLALAAALPASCDRGDTLFGLPTGDVAARLEQRDYAFLRTGHFDDRQLRRVSVLGDGAYHNLARVFEHIERADTSARLLKLSWERDDEPWKRESALLRIDRLLEGEQFALALELAGEAHDQYPDDLPVAHRYRDALYRNREFDQLRDSLATSVAPDDQAASWMRAEHALWEAVLSEERGDDEQHELTVALFTDHQIDDAHSRFALYVRARPNFAAGFTEAELSLFTAKQLAAEGRYEESLPAFTAALSAAPELATETVLRDLFVVGLNAKATLDAADLLAATAPQLRTGAQTTSLAFEYAGRLYRIRQRFTRAAEVLSAAVVLAQEDEHRQRALWYLRDVELMIDPLGAVRRLASTIERIDDPRYFDDYFDNLASILIERRAWSELRDVYERLRGVAAPGVVARMQLVLAEVATQGLARGADDAEELVERAAAQRDDLYFAIMASARRGESVDLATAWSATVAQQREPVATDPALTALVGGYRRVGLLEQAEALHADGAERVAYEEALALVRALSAAESNRSAIRAALRLRRHRGYDPEDGVLARAYPYALSTLIDRVADAEGLDRHLLRALVREESLFDPTAVSWAGAVGVSQLMPATAADVASRMRFDYDDLTDPEQNLRIGGHYLSLLLAQFGLPVHALAAYNAGQGRVRGWERTLPTESEILFVESIPFDETRRYIRQVLVSFAYYGYLYADRSSIESATKLFPDL